MRLRGFHLLALLMLAAGAMPVAGLRANLRSDLARLEEMGHYEQCLFYRRCTMDMILAVHVAWSGAPYDPAMDRLYVETRTDRRYWNLVNDQKRPITELLKKARLSPAQIGLLNERVRVYVEDHLSPDFDEMGNFYFRRKAWAMERMGLFHDASFRRRLTGYYDQRVCSAYYATMSHEFRQQGNAAQAGAYAAKSQWYLAQAQRELRRCNGDQRLAQLRGAGSLEMMPRSEIITLLNSQLTSTDADTRFAAASILVEMDQLQLLQGLRDDPDADVSALAGSIKPTAPLAAGLKQGVMAAYFSSPDQRTPVARMVLPGAQFGLRGNERFPDKLRPAWDGPDVIPPGASGQFLVRLSGKLAIPREGHYRFYVKTDGGNRATVRLQRAGAAAITLISPRNDRKLLYSVQNDWKGNELTRVDFSVPVALEAGLVDLEIQYKGAQVKGAHGTAGLRLNWSSDDRVMEPVPSSAFWHDP